MWMFRREYLYVTRGSAPVALLLSWLVNHQGEKIAVPVIAASTGLGEHQVRYGIAILHTQGLQRQVFSRGVLTIDLALDDERLAFLKEEKPIVVQLPEAPPTPLADLGRAYADATALAPTPDIAQAIRSGYQTHGSAITLAGIKAFASARQNGRTAATAGVLAKHIKEAADRIPKNADESWTI